MFKTYAKQVREFIGALVLLSLGVYIGHRLSEQERVQSVVSITASRLAFELASDAAILQNLKMDRVSCARWLLELNVRSQVNAIKHLREDPDRSNLSLVGLEKVVEIGESALNFEDKPQLNAGVACSP